MTMRNNFSKGDHEGPPVQQSASELLAPVWWRDGILYQIYPRSFLDTNGDGVGDLKGITEKLPYLKELGVTGVWISPFFTSPMKDFGYDVSDYKGIDPLFGTMADFDALVARASDLGLKIIIDLVLSHTSDEHPWFRESRQDATNPKADWYVWADAKDDGTPPNNWLSIFGGSAWQWDPYRCQYYFHNFLASQPDLNFHCPAVQEAVLDVAKYWLDKGVSGFRLDTVNFYTHDDQLRDNPGRPRDKRLDVAVFNTNPYAFQYHIYDKSRPENLLFVKKLRALLDQYDAVTSIGEIGDDDSIARACEYVQGDDKLHMAYTFTLLQNTFTAAHFRDTILEVESQIGDGWPCWSFGNHDTVRTVSRFGIPEHQWANGAKMLGALLVCLRGTPIFYQGEELGLPEADLALGELQDPYGIAFYPAFKGRDGCRTPLPWLHSAPNAGFTSAVRPWLPVAAPHVPLAVEAQMENTREASPGTESVLRFYQQLAAFYNREPVLQRGAIQNVKVLDACAGQVLYFERVMGGTSRRCWFNCSDKEVMVPDVPGQMLLANNADLNPPQGKSKEEVSGFSLKPYGFILTGIAGKP